MDTTFTQASDITGSAVLSPSSYVGALAVEDQLVVVDERTGRGHALNPTASLIWRCLDGQATLAEIIADLADFFATPIATVEGDVTRIVQNFGALGLLESVVRSIHSLPIEIEYVDPDACDEPTPAEQQDVDVDLRYLMPRPNG